MNLQAESAETQPPGLRQGQVLEACPDVHDLKLAARFTTHRRIRKISSITSSECYTAALAHPGFGFRVQVDRYWHTTHGK